MPNKRPLQQQPVDKLISSKMSSPATTFSMAPPSIPSAIPPKPVSQPMPQQNVIRNAGLQMLPEESMQPEDDSSNFLASLIAQGVAGIGTGLMGGSPKDIMHSANMFQYMRDQETSRNKAKLLMDPKSEESKKRREVFKKLGYNVPDNFSYTDLNDPTVLQTLKGQMEQSRLAAMPRGGGGAGGAGGAKQQKSSEIDKEDVKKISAMADLNNSIDNLISSVETHGKARIGEEALNQNDLKYSIAASSGVIKGQGAMTEPDIKFWDDVLSPSATGSKEDYINRMKKKKSEYVKGITKSLELKGYIVKPTADGKYSIFDKNENFVGQY